MICDRNTSFISYIILFGPDNGKKTTRFHEDALHATVCIDFDLFMNRFTFLADCTTVTTALVESSTCKTCMKWN